MDVAEHDVERVESAQPRSDRPMRWPAWVAGTLTLLTLGMWLLGYGYALAIESRFGIAQAHVVTSTLDYLSLAGHAVVQLLLYALDNVRSPRAWWAGYAAAWPWVAGFLVAFWTLLAVMFWPLLRPLRRTATVGSGRLAQQVRAHWQTSRVPWLGVLASVMVAGLPVVATALGWFALLVGLSLMSLLPMLGHKIGTDAMQRWVVEPQRCAPLVSRDQRLELARTGGRREAMARCVAVRAGAGIVAKGRLVAATAQVAVLFDPRTGAVWRVPVGDATVEPVAALDP